MNRREVLSGALVSAAFTTPPSLPRQDEPDISAKMRAYYEPLAATRDVSGKLRIERAGRISEAWFGAPDFAARTSWDTHTRFACASITKSMTATILLKLAEGGALSLSDALSAHLPDYQHGQAISFEHVLRHSAGLARDIPAAEREALGAGGLIGWLNAHPPSGTPGETERYSNVGYELLAVAAERIGGRPYRRLAQEIIFDPLGMRQSSIETSSVNAVSARPHIVGPPPEEIQVDTASAMPTGAAGACMSIDDMVRWVRAVHEGTIVQLKQADGRFLGSVLSFEEAGRTALFLQGTIRGSGAGVALFPDDNVAVVYALNLESYPQLSAQRVLAKIAFDVDPGAPSLRPPAAPLTDAHRALAGLYESNSFGQLSIYEVSQPAPQMRIVMLGLGIDQYATPVSDGRLNWRTFNFTFSARRDASGAITGLDVEQTMFGPEANTMRKLTE